MNAITTNTDDSEDVSDFLQRIRELGDQRDREDEERNQKLEEEILQGRKEREARRAGQSLASGCPSISTRDLIDFPRTRPVLVPFQVPCGYAPLRQHVYARSKYLAWNRSAKVSYKPTTCRQQLTSIGIHGDIVES